MKACQSRILFVEDHEDTRDLVALVLERSDYAVSTASAIGDAVKLARSENFNLFLVDSGLPDGSGIDFCRYIREFDQHTPILFYSGLADEEDKDAALSAGAQAYLVKPVNMPALRQAVRELISTRANAVDRLAR